MSNNPFHGAYAYRMPPTTRAAVVFNDLCTILERATAYEAPAGNEALALSVLSVLTGAIALAEAGDRTHLKELAEWACIAAQRASAQIEARMMTELEGA